MKLEKMHLYMDEYEQGIIIKALNELRNNQLTQGLTTDAIDDVLLKTAYAPKKKLRIVEREFNESRESR